MANWTTIDTNSLLPGSPITSPIMLALEENPRAITEGAVGAPKVLPLGLGGQFIARASNSGPTITTIEGLELVSQLWIFGLVTGINLTGPTSFQFRARDDTATWSAWNNVGTINGGTNTSAMGSGCVYFDPTTGAISAFGVGASDSASGNVTLSTTLIGSGWDAVGFRMAAAAGFVAYNAMGFYAGVPA